MKLSTGISGLDEILLGGLLPEKAYLVRGASGCGKTILGIHFLLAGIKNNETVLFITLSETEKNIRNNIKSLNLDIDGLNFLDLSPESKFFSKVETYDIFSPADVERQPVTTKIVETTETLKPKRVFIDSMTQLRYLATDVYNYRRQVLSFLRFIKENGITVLFTSEHSHDAPDDDLMFICDGIITLSFSTEKGRSIEISKYRGSDFLKGKHTVKITENGISVFPNIIPKEIYPEVERQVISSGIPEIDELLMGGIEKNTITIITGPSGTGKTTLGTQFAKETAARGENSAIYLFEENVNIFTQRCELIKIPIKEMIKKGTLRLEFIEPLLYSADEFSDKVRKDVEMYNLNLVMIDSIHGYRLAMGGGSELQQRLHSLCKSLILKGVTVLIINETELITGDFKATEHGISYLADNIVFLRYIEIKGQLKKAIGILKKRLSDFEKTLRELEITKDGIKVGVPLVNLRGILKGTPDWDD